MSRRRAATNVVSYSELDTSFSDFVKTAHVTASREASKYACTKNDVSVEDLLQSVKSPGLTDKHARRTANTKATKDTEVRQNRGDVPS